jgi:hypothetical protein
MQNLTWTVLAVLVPAPAAQAGTTFADEFETGDVSAWDCTFTPNPGTMEVTTNSPPQGTYALEITPEEPTGQVHLLVCDWSPDAETEYQASFRIDLRSFGLDDSAIPMLIYLFDEEGNPGGILRFRQTSGGDWELQLAVWDDNSVFRAVPTTGWATVTPVLSQNPVVIQWKAATGPTSNDGYLGLWINGSLAGERSDIDNYEQDIGEIWFGLAGGNIVDPSGSYHLDSFVSTDQIDDPCP